MGISVRNLNVKGGVVVGPPIVTPVGGFQSGDFDFTLAAEQGDTNTVTFTKSGTICISGDRSDQNTSAYDGYGSFNGNDTNVRWYPNESDALLYKQTESVTGVTGQMKLTAGFSTVGRRFSVIDVNVNDTLKLNINRTNGDPTAAYSLILTFTNSTFNGTTIDTLTTSKAAGCYLTTATVIYKGLDDNGPELTAMRLLREHYAGDPYYENLIVEYYQNASTILDGINNSVNPNSEYEFIYQSVLKVKNFVDQELWEDAGNEYMNTYIILKNKYI